MKILFTVFILCAVVALGSCSKDKLPVSDAGYFITYEDGYQVLNFPDQQSIENYLGTGIAAKTLSPGDGIPCDSLQNRNLYPDLFEDDYLNEWRFAGLYHVFIVDHCVTRKVINIFMPPINDSITASGSTDTLNLCDVKFTIQNPVTHVKAVFYDVYNWIDAGGKPIFNCNRIIHSVWPGLTESTTFVIQFKHMPTGGDMNFDHSTLTLRFAGL